MLNSAEELQKLTAELEQTLITIKEDSEKQNQKELLLSLVISNYETVDDYITKLIEDHGYEEAFKITQESRICEFTLNRNSNDGN